MAMQIQKGLVKYKDRTDIVCTYGVTGDNVQYYFINDEKLHNGNIVATTSLLEAVDPTVVASHIGVVDPDGKEIISCNNREIKEIADGILLVEKADNYSSNVLESINMKDDPLASTKLVTTPATIKDNLNRLMGNQGKYLFNNQFSEASIFDFDGNNLVNNEYYSFIGINDENIYLSKNASDSNIVEYSLADGRIQIIDSTGLNISIPVVSEDDDQTISYSEDSVYSEEDNTLSQDDKNDSFSSDILNDANNVSAIDSSVSVDNVYEEESVTENDVSVDTTLSEEVDGNESTNGGQQESVSLPTEDVRKETQSAALPADEVQDNNESIALPVNDVQTETEVVADAVATVNIDDSNDTYEEPLNIDISASELKNESTDDAVSNAENSLPKENVLISAKIPTEQTEQEKKESSEIQETESGSVEKTSDSNKSHESLQSISQTEEENVYDNFDYVSDKIGGYDNINSYSNDYSFDEDFEYNNLLENFEFNSSIANNRSNGNIFDDVTVTISNLVELNKSLQSTIDDYDLRLTKCMGSRKKLLDLSKKQSREIASLNARVARLESEKKVLENKLATLSPASNGNLARVMADAQNILGQTKNRMRNNDNI